MSSREETVRIIRPFKILSAVSAFISLVLLIVSIACTTWLTADGGFSQGLWVECYQSASVYGCHKGRSYSWLQAVGALSIISLLIAAVGFLLICVGLAIKDQGRKFSLYRSATFIFILAFVCLIIALIVFPSMYSQYILEQQPRSHWYYDWAYGLGWAADFFQAGAFIMLLIEWNREEVYYRDKLENSSRA